MLVGVCLRPDTVAPGVVAGGEVDMYGPFGGSPGEYRQTFMVGPAVAPPRQSAPAVCRPLEMSLLQLEGRVGDRLVSLRRMSSALDHAMIDKIAAGIDE